MNYLDYKYSLDMEKIPDRYYTNREEMIRFIPNALDDMRFIQFACVGQKIEQ